MVNKKSETGLINNLILPAFKGVLIFIAASSILASLASFIWYRTNVMKLANEVNHLQEQKKELDKRREELLAEILQKESYTRILKLASKKIGLVPSDQKPILFKVPREEYLKLHK